MGYEVLTPAQDSPPSEPNIPIDRLNSMEMQLIPIQGYLPPIVHSPVVDNCTCIKKMGGVLAFTSIFATLVEIMKASKAQVTDPDRYIILSIPPAFGSSYCLISSIIEGPVSQKWIATSRLVALALLATPLGYVLNASNHDEFIRRFSNTLFLAPIFTAAAVGVAVAPYITRNSCVETPQPHADEWWRCS